MLDLSEATDTAENLELYNAVILVMTQASAIVSGAFVISYGFFFLWRLTAAGRAIMYLMVSLFLTFTVVSLFRVLGPGYPGRYIITLIVYGLVLGTLIHVLVSLWTNYGTSKSDVVGGSKTGDTETAGQEHPSRGASTAEERPDSLTP